MANFNKVLLMGNLTRDPEVRTTPTGMKIAKFGMAVNRRFRTRDNEAREETTFVDLDAFGNQAEIIEKYCQKGSPLFVEGRLRLDQWETPNGEKRSKLGIVVENFQFLGSGGSQERSDEPRATQDNPRPAQDSGSSGGDSFDDDEVPF
ncbi:MAG: single-stranded DNA-binding protein [Puniceicoccaceae bacterium]